jgi:hypothetical protein
MCECIKFEIALTGETFSTTYEVQTSGLYNGKNYWEFTHSGQDFVIFFDSVAWIVGDSLGNVGPYGSRYATTDDCPISPLSPNPIDPVLGWSNSNNTFANFETLNCDEIGDCECGISVTYSNQSQGVEPGTVVATVSGIYNNRLEFTFLIGGITYLIQWNPTFNGWEIYQIFAPLPPSLIGKLNDDSLCPIGTIDDWVGSFGWEFFTEKKDCKECGLEDRTQKQYGSIKLPTPFVEQDRGFDECCCEYMVLASASQNPFENDVTSAWIEISDPTDQVVFELWKNNTNTGMMFDLESFPNEDLAQYITFGWDQVFNEYGAGCYELRVNYEIAGVVGQYIYATYNLKQYTIENALNTARIKVIFNGKHDTSGLDFTGTNIVDTFRFYGYIGNRQPNTEIDNIIYGNREMKRVIRENLNTYEIITDPSLDCIIKPLIDLYLLSENELYISDYNAHNHSYRYIDLPVIVSESPEIEYYEFSRKAKLTCVVSDKFKTNRTKY